MLISQTVPSIYIIAGCNGAGKTTASFTILPEILNCREFINADEIAKGLSPFHPEKVAIQAGRLMLERMNILMNQEVDFAFETTLTTLSYKQIILAAKEKGYRINLLFFWLNDVNLGIERVAKRVSYGGNHIPEDVIKRRYYKGLINLTNIFIHICDYWIVVDNSQKPFQAIAKKAVNQQPLIFNNDMWQLINSANNERD